MPIELYAMAQHMFLNPFKLNDGFQPRSSILDALNEEFCRIIL